MTTSYHDPAPDRLLARPAAWIAGALPARVAPVVLSLLGLTAALAALAALLADARTAGGALIVVAALCDAVADASSRTRHGGFAAIVDGLADRYGDLCIIGAMAAWSHAHDGPAGTPAIALAALTGTMVLGYMSARVHASAGGATARTLFGGTGRDARLILAAAGVLTGQVYPSLIALALVTNIPVCVALVRLRARLAAG